MDSLNPRTSHPKHDRRSRRIRPYLIRSTHTSPAPPSLLLRVLDGLRALPAAPPSPRRDERTPLIRHIDAERARTVADRTPTEEIPVVAQGVSWR